MVHLVHAFVKRPQSSVWIIPGSMDDFEDPANEHRYLHVDDYLPKRGVLVASRVEPAEAARIVADSMDKFRQAGFEAVEETLCDD